MTQPAAGRHAPLTDPVVAAKAELREAIRARRSRRSLAEQADQDRRRTELATAALDQLTEPIWLAGYLSVAGEPGTTDLLAAALQRGHRVLVPLLSDGAGRGLRQPDWAEYTGPDRLRSGWHSIPEPDAPGLGGQALARADLVIGSALAATADGRRLGTGGGWYDRALAHRREGVPLWLLLHDDEVLDQVPTEPHDQPAQLLITPTRVIGMRTPGEALRSVTGLPRTHPNPV